jgi:alkaline phosphatase D
MLDPPSASEDIVFVGYTRKMSGLSKSRLRAASFASLAAAVFLAAAALAADDGGPAIERLAFGSCSDQERPQPIWDVIAAFEPQLFLHLGDSVYSDTVDMDRRRADLAKQAAVPEFRRFRDKVPILATWDDHDFGANDGGADFPEREVAEKLFLDFFDEPADSPRRRRPGVYDARIFGPPGQRLQVILLDGRSFRGRLEDDPSPYRRYRPATDPGTTLLGEAQWTWLEEQLRRPAELRLIASGVQVLGYAAGFECWKNLPHEQERLFRVIRETAADGVLFLSGDAHFAQLKRGDGGVGYPLYDFTSSGLTHSRPEAAERPAPLAVEPPFGGINFGTVEIDWHQKDPEITLAARDLEGKAAFVHRIRLSELRARWQVVD